jgi:tetratricopeptide (TPR) repeat protein
MKEAMEMKSRLNLLMAAVFGFAAALNPAPVLAQAATTMDFGPDIEEADHHRMNLRVAEAEAAYQRAHAKSPDDPTVLVRYSSFKRTLGEYDEAIRLLRRAEESIANGGVLIGGPEYLQLTLGITYYRTGIDYERAAAIFREFIEEYPDAAAYHSHLAFSEIGRGNEAEALRNLQLAEQLFGDRLNSYRGATLALGYAKLGRSDDVRRLFGRLQEMESVSQAAWSAAYIALGDYDQARQHFETAITNPESISGATNVLYFVADNPFRDPALEDARFQELFNRLRGK